MVTPAKLPESMKQSSACLLSQMEVGDRLCMFAAEMVVDLDGSCYVYKDSRMMRDTHLPPLTVWVERREDGFHVIAHPSHRWELRAPHLRDVLLPVVSLTVEGEEKPG